MLTNVEKDTLSHVLRCFHASEDYTYRYFERAKDHYKHYRLYRSKEKFPYANSVFTPDTFTFVEDIASKIVQTLIARSPIYSVIPRYGGTEKIAQQVERALQYCIENEDFEFFLEFCDLIKNGGIFGTSFMGVYPDFEFDLTGQLSYIGPRYEFTDFWDIFPDPNARRLNKRARYIIKRSIIHTEELEDLGAKGIYEKSQVNKVKKLRAGNLEQERRDILQEIGVESFIPEEQDLHERFEYFSGGHCITIVDRQVVVKDTTKNKINPYPYHIPLVDYRYTQVPGEFYGIGIPEIVKDLQADKNVIRSQRRENVDLILNKILKVRRGGDVDIDTLKFFPGAIWELDQPDDITEHDMRDVTQSAYQEEEKIDLDMENATGSYRYSRGQNPQREETATAVVRLQKAAMSRFDIIIKQAEFSAMRKIARMVVLQMRTFMPQEMYERIIGEPDAGFYSIPIKDITHFYDFMPLGSSITNIKEVRAQQIMQAQQMLMGVPPEVQQQGGFTVNYRETIRMGLEEALDIKNVDRLIPAAPMPQPQAQPMPMPPGGLPSQVPPEVLLQEAMMGGGGNGGMMPPGMPPVIPPGLPLPVSDLGGGIQ
jgi:hypothetical protein